MQNVDDPISLGQAAREAPGNPSPHALWRWARRGIKSRAGHRVFLEHTRLGGRIYTTRSALERFGRAVADADLAHFATTAQQAPVMSSQRQRDVDFAERQCEAAGI